MVEDVDGSSTLNVLARSYAITKRIAGNSPESLGLHPIVYFYNERGKHSRFLFLGMVMLIAERVRNNDDAFFQKFTRARKVLENFLIEYKSLIGILLEADPKRFCNHRMSHFSALRETGPQRTKKVA